MNRKIPLWFKDVLSGKWYSPIPAEQIALGGKLNPEAQRRALQEEMEKWNGK